MAGGCGVFERQTSELLFPKILWNRPISRATAGRLLVVGGHKHGVANLQGTYQIAQAAGIGALSLLVPDALRPMLGTIPELAFAPSTHSGSLAKAALAELIDMSSHADTTLIGVNTSNNSETAILLESFVGKFQQPLVVADDGLEIIALTPELFAHRPNTLVILTMQQLFKLAGKLQLPLTIKPDTGLAGKVSILTELWNILKIDIALIGPEIIIKVGDKVSLTPLAEQPASLLPTAFAVLSVFYTQNPKARYEGLTTGAFLIRQAAQSAANPSIGEVCSSLTEALNSHE